MEIPKEILDATCGSRAMWFDKNNEKVLFADQRTETIVQCDGRTLVVNPDVTIDFCNMPFPDDTFYLTVFDPPHFEKLGKNSWLAQKYGKLLPSWEMDIRAGLNECMRVTRPNGIVIFKWNERQIKVNKILSIIDHKPLFGHTTSRNGETIWMTFMKSEAMERIQSGRNMTITTFNETRWGAGMTVEYDGKERKVGSVDFREKLIGLQSLEEPEINDDGEPEDLPFDWVRCENCRLL